LEEIISDLKIDPKIDRISKYIKESNKYSSNQIKNTYDIIDEINIIIKNPDYKDKIKDYLYLLELNARTKNLTWIEENCLRKIRTIDNDELKKTIQYISENYSNDQIIKFCKFEDYEEGLSQDKVNMKLLETFNPLLI